jgi:molybdate transport system regulatory protein
MKVSARNVFSGKVSAIHPGAVNAEVELTLDGGDVLVAVITDGSLKHLGLATGMPATAIVKAPWVVLARGDNDTKFSARNHLHGVVSGLTKAAVNTEVAVTLRGGSVLHAVVTNESVSELGLALDLPVGVLIKSSNVVLAVST